MKDWTGVYAEALREHWARKRVAAFGKDWATRMAKFDGTVVPREVTDWSRYRACSQICRAKTGEPCFSMNGKIVNGQPDGVLTPLDVPHKSRKLLAKYARQVA